jgi:hypothetical protein
MPVTSDDVYVYQPNTRITPLFNYMNLAQYNLKNILDGLNEDMDERLEELEEKVTNKIYEGLENSRIFPVPSRDEAITILQRVLYCDSSRPVFIYRTDTKVLYAVTNRNGTNRSILSHPMFYTSRSTGFIKGDDTSIMYDKYTKQPVAQGLSGVVFRHQATLNFARNGFMCTVVLGVKNNAKAIVGNRHNGEPIVKVIDPEFYPYPDTFSSLGMFTQYTNTVYNIQGLMTPSNTINLYAVTPTVSKGQPFSIAGNYPVKISDPW